MHRSVALTTFYLYLKWMLLALKNMAAMFQKRSSYSTQTQTQIKCQWHNEITNKCIFYSNDTTVFNQRQDYNDCAPHSMYPEVNITIGFAWLSQRPCMHYKQQSNTANAYFQLWKTGTHSLWRVLQHTELDLNNQSISSLSKATVGVMKDMKNTDMLINISRGAFESFDSWKQ